MTTLDLFEVRMAHIPVLKEEVLKYLSPIAGKYYVDATFGAGGYTKAILSSCQCNVIGVDQDPDVEKYANEISREFNQRFTFVLDNFANIGSVLNKLNIDQVDGLVLDLGVSSMQLDESSRGFSFMRDAQLDMRMSKSGKTAYDFVNNASETELADVIYHFGEERDARKIARAIVEARMNGQIKTTTQLANITRGAIGFRKSKIDLATKTFQAIRIWVNDELESLNKFLQNVHNFIAPGGRLIIVSFHSLEDSIIKNYTKEFGIKKVARSKYAKTPLYEEGFYHILTRRAIKPSLKEIILNPRSRSAKLRAMQMKG